MTFDYAIRVLERRFNKSWDGSYIAPWTYGDQCGDTYHQFGINVVNHNEVIPLAKYHLSQENN